jgi:hypothetical protein
MKNLLYVVLILFVCAFASAQQPYLLGSNVGGVFTPWTSGLFTGQIPQPPSILAKCKNGNLTVDCDFNGGGGGSFTALTGDATSTSTGGATTVVGLRGHILPSLSTGFLEWTGTAWALAAGGTGATFPSTNGDVCNTSTTASIPCTPNLYAENFSGADAGAKINACNAAAVAAGGGVCDDRAVLTLSATASAEIEIGDPASGDDTVRHIWPAQFNLTSTFTDATKCAVRVWNRGILDGEGIGGGGTRAFISIGTGATMQGGLCTDTSNSNAQNYVRIVGVSVINLTGATVPNLVDIEDLGDQSEYGQSYSNNWSGNSMYFANLCCGFYFHDLQAFGSNPSDPTVGGDALVLGGYGYGSIISSTFNRPKTGTFYNVNITGSWNLQAYNLYMEGNANDTTPMVNIGSASTGTSFVNSEFNPCLGGGCRVVGKYSLVNNSGYDYSIVGSIGGNYPGDPMMMDNAVGRVTCLSAGQRNLAPACSGGPDNVYFEHTNTNSAVGATLNFSNGTFNTTLTLPTGGGSPTEAIIPGGGFGTQLFFSKSGPSAYGFSGSFDGYANSATAYLPVSQIGDIIRTQSTGKYYWTNDEVHVGAYFDNNTNSFNFPNLVPFGLGINLNGANSPLLLNGSAGSAGTTCVVSAGGGNTPTWGACGGGGSFTALTGDATSTSTGGATEVVGLLNHALPSLTAGFLNWTGSAWALSAPFTLTTTGTSGAATFSGGTLNIPQYAGGGSGLPCSGTCTAGIIPLFGSGGTSITNSLLDYGVTNSGKFTAAAALVITGTNSGISGAGTLPSPTGGQGGVFFDGSGNTYYSDAGGAFARIAGVADITITVGSGVAFSANTCSSYTGTANTASTTTFTGFATSMTAYHYATSDTKSVTGWGPGSGGQLYFSPGTPSAGNLVEYVCNSTSSTITTGASVTFNVSAR